MVNSCFTKWLYQQSTGGRNLNDFRGMGRARTLLIAMVDFRRRERGQRSPSPPPVQWGRAGAPAFNLGIGRKSSWCQSRCAVTRFHLRGRGRERGLRSPSPPTLVEELGQGLYPFHPSPLPTPGPARPRSRVPSPTKCSHRPL